MTCRTLVSLGHSRLFALGVVPFLGAACAHTPLPSRYGEVRLENLRQLTSSGTNAGAHWTYDGKRLVVQHKNGPEVPCDQILELDPRSGALVELFHGPGSATGAYALPGDERILFSFFNKRTTPERDVTCPVSRTSQIYSVKRDGSDPLPLEPGAPTAYNAEAKTCKDGSVVFTSDRDGDLDLYVGKLDRFGTMIHPRRITQELGYDGGAVFSPDCKRIAWQAARPRTRKERAEYGRFLSQHLVSTSPTAEIWVANADGSQARQVTRLGGSNLAPAFTPDGKKILFASDLRKPGSGDFDLYLIDIGGTRLERVTRSGRFESFPSFSPDGKRLAFSSMRGTSQRGETQVFVADWIERPDRSLEWEDESPADRLQAVINQLRSSETRGRAHSWIKERLIQLGLTTVEATSRISGRTRGACSASQFPLVISARLDPSRLDRPESLSGVAGLLELARRATSQPQRFPGCLWFTVITGEENGAAEAVALPTHAKAILSLERIGRMEGNHAFLTETRTTPGWKSLVQRACEAEGLRCTDGGAGLSPKNQGNLSLKGVPKLHFTGSPEFYEGDDQRPRDADETINATGAIQVIDLAARIIESVFQGRASL